MSLKAAVVSVFAVWLLTLAGCSADCEVCCTYYAAGYAPEEYCSLVTDVDKSLCEECDLPEVRSAEAEAKYKAVIMEKFTSK